MPPIAHIALALVHALVAILASGLVFGVSIVFEEPAGMWLGVLVLIATIGAGAASQSRFAEELRDAGGALTGKPMDQAAAAVSLYRTRVSGGRMALEEALAPENIAYDMRRQRKLLDQVAMDRHAEKWERMAREIERRLGRSTAADKRARRMAIGGADEQETLRRVERAIRGDGFALIARPITALPSRKVAMRDYAFAMREPDGTLRPPDDWASLAEDAGLSPFIDNLMLIRVARRMQDAARRRRAEGAYIHLSGASLNDSTVLREIVTVLDGDAAALSPRIVIGVAQRDWPELSDEALSALFHLAGAGYALALDQPQDVDFNPDALRARRIKYVVAPSALLLVRRSGAADTPEAERFREKLNAYAVDLIIDRIDDDERYRDVMDFKPAFGAGALFGGFAPADGRPI